jgi:hypothetical protein
MKDKSSELYLVGVVEGKSVYLNDCRIAGNKPWGGGKVISSWKVNSKEIADQLPIEVLKKSISEREK